VSFQPLPPALASHSGFLVSLSTSRSALEGSTVSDLHPWWPSPTRHSPTWLFTPPPWRGAGWSLVVRKRGYVEVTSL